MARQRIYGKSLKVFRAYTPWPSVTVRREPINHIAAVGLPALIKALASEAAKRAAVLEDVRRFENVSAGICLGICRHEPRRHIRGRDLTACGMAIRLRGDKKDATDVTLKEPVTHPIHS